MIKKIIALTLTLCALLSLFIPLNVSAEVEELIYFTTKEEAEQLIQETLGQRHKDYSGWCGSYTYDMLQELDILDSQSACYDGKDWYPAYKNNYDANILNENWTYECFDGQNSLKEVLEKYNGKVYNLVLSMPSGPYGHVMFVNAIIDDKVYFSESYDIGTFNSKQKELIVADLDDFISYYYYSDYFKMNKGGIIHFYEKDFYKPIILFGGSPKIPQENVYKFKYTKPETKNDAMYNDLKDNLSLQQYESNPKPTIQKTPQQNTTDFVEKIKDFFSFLPFL